MKKIFIFLMAIFISAHHAAFAKEVLFCSTFSLTSSGTSYASDDEGYIPTGFAPHDWKASNGAQGVAVCSAIPTGVNLYDTSENGDLKFCFCKMYAPIVTDNWYFVRYNDEDGVYPSETDCLKNCPNACASNVKNIYENSSYSYSY